MSVRGRAFPFARKSDLRLLLTENTRPYFLSRRRPRSRIWRLLESITEHDTQTLLLVAGLTQTTLLSRCKAL
jgi:hypothetical protein